MPHAPSDLVERDRHNSILLAARKPLVAQIGKWSAYGTYTVNSFSFPIVLTADEKGAIIRLKFRTDHRLASVLRR